ncbi:hypothetical protein GQ457_06G007480 [Hibiscus cannabinus]
MFERHEFGQIPVRNPCKAGAGREFDQIPVRNPCKAGAGREFDQIPVRNPCKAGAGREFGQISVRNPCKAGAEREFNQIPVRNPCKAGAGREFDQIPVRNPYVAYHLGLPVDGHAITGKAEDNWFLLGRELLGVDPVDLDGGRVLITWLDEHFSDLPNNASIQLNEQFARAHILRVIGGILMPDKSRNKVHLMWLRHLRVFSDAGKFSWGSAVLAFLFRELCKTTDPSKHVIGGCLLLLQSWAWFRMPFIRPTLHQPTPYIFPLILRWTGPLSHVGLPDCQRDFRLLIDKNDEFLWTPYADPEIFNCVPPHIFQGAQVWMSKVPLINYDVIEWHPVDRVLRQFNYVQPIPRQPENWTPYTA